MFFEKRYEAVSGFRGRKRPVGRGDGHSGTGAAQAVRKDVACLFGPDEQDAGRRGNMGQEAVGQRFGPVLRRHDVGPQAV